MEISKMFIAYNNYQRLSDGEDIKDYKAFYKKISNQIEFGGSFTNYDYLVKYRFMNIFPHIYNAVLRKHPSNILDVGCGNGINLPLANIFPTVEYHGLDYAEKAIESAKREYQNIKFHIEDAFNTSFRGNSFDMIILSSVLILYKEKDDQVKLLNEIRRILMDDGIFILVVWKESFFLKQSIQLSRVIGKLLKQNLPKDFMAVYFSISDINELASKANFKIKESFHPSAHYGVLESIRYLNMSKYNRKYGKSESESTITHSQNILEDLQAQAGGLKYLTKIFYYMATLFPKMFSHYSVYILEKK